MSKQQSKQELQDEVVELRASNKYLNQTISDFKKQRWKNSLVSIAQPLIFWIGLVTLAYWAYRSIDALAGKSTDADVNLWAGLSLGDAAQAIVSVFSIAYGVNQRRLRQNTIAETGNRIEELEKQVDPNRSSSGLTRIGTTNPEDK